MFKYKVEYKAEKELFTTIADIVEMFAPNSAAVTDLRALESFEVKAELGLADAVRLRKAAAEVKDSVGRVSPVVQAAVVAVRGEFLRLQPHLEELRRCVRVETQVALKEEGHEAQEDTFLFDGADGDPEAA